jgi:hypothetical protein
MRLDRQNGSSDIICETNSFNSNLSGELSIHSSDDELDEYIIATPEMIAKTQRLCRIQQEERKWKEDEKEVNEEQEEKEDFFCEQVLTHTYLALGIDLLGSDLRKIKMISRKKNKFTVLNKRNLELLNENPQENKKHGLYSFKKVKLNESQQICLRSEENQVKISDQSEWIQNIFDELSEMNKSLLRKLKKEFLLACKSIQLKMYETLLMLIRTFRKDYYNHSLSIQDNLKKFINLLSEFFRSHSILKKNYLKANSLSTSLNIE